MKTHNLRHLILLVALGSLSNIAYSADSNELKRGQGVKSRTQEDYSRVGIKVSGFNILPTFVSENEYRDNIYATQRDVRDDFIFHLQPGLAAKSNWNRHELTANVSADVQFFASKNQEDKQNHFFDIGGRFDVVRDSFASAKFYYSNQFEARGAPDSPFSALRPIEYSTLGGEVGYQHKFNRVKLNIANDVKQFSFTDGITGDGTFIHNTDRDRTVNTSSGRIGYEITPGYEAFVKGSYNFVDYDILVDDNGVRRSSDGYEIASGLALDFTGKLIGDMYVGYRSQTYDDAQLKSIGDITGGVGLTWLPTGLTTVTARVDRSIVETTQGLSSGSFNTASTLNVDHELHKNIILSLNGGYTQIDFRGGQGRQDDVYNAGLAGKYLLNRNLYLKGGYNYSSRSVNIINNNYDIHHVYFTIGVQI